MIHFNTHVLLVLALVGGLVAVDGTSFGQFMISRPFVAATLGGWVAGMPQQGAILGVALECFHLGVLPVGASKQPESGPAAVAAGAFFAGAEPTASILILTILGTLLLEHLGGWTVHLERLINVWIIAPNGALPTVANLERRHLTAIGLDFLRGAVLVMIGSLLLSLVVPVLDPYWGLSESLTNWMVVTFIIAMLAGSLRMLGSKYWFAALGAGIGLVGLWMTR
ncbi:MAG: PTS sugar transporter subunit IIC [Gemmatimonadota bacterium]|jgi:mannose/fructose/N-acetylgalactosamine-specific phosphotransferase system component IIC|nr:PTS sugar transporter subunit IIC [Gemmatimonadota bacterium]